MCHSNRIIEFGGFDARKEKKKKVSYELHAHRSVVSAFNREQLFRTKYRRFTCFLKSKAMFFGSTVPASVQGLFFFLARKRRCVQYPLL